MKLHDGKEYYNITEVSKRVGRTVQTILNWYNAETYYKENQLKFPMELPQPRTDLDKRHIKYWTKEQIDTLFFFKQNLKSGDLSKFSIKLWGERGERFEQLREMKRQIKEAEENKDGN